MAAAGYQQPPQQYPPQGGYQQPPAGYQQPGYPQQPVYQQQGAASSGLQENVAGLLCYLVGWITGIIFLIIDKRPSVKFHAAQSIVVFGGIQILQVVIWTVLYSGWMFGSGFGFMSWGLGTMLMGVLGLLTFILWILLMIKAYQGEAFRVPLASNIADGLAGK
jgi:uncharacterized membrane protein